MKKILLILMLFMLSACEETDIEEYEYDDLDVEQVSSYLEGETMDGKYILYYYSETCPGCNSIKQEVIPFFMDFSLLEVFLLNTGEMHDVSTFVEFVGTPSLFVIDGSKILYDTYIGVDRVREFMDEYENFTASESLFNHQQITTLEDFTKFEGSYVFLYSDNIVPIDVKLWADLFRLETKELALVNVDQADENLLNELGETRFPTLLVILDESVDSIYGEENILRYLESE